MASLYTKSNHNNTKKPQSTKAYKKLTITKSINQPTNRYFTRQKVDMSLSYVSSETKQS